MSAKKATPGQVKKLTPGQKKQLGEALKGQVSPAKIKKAVDAVGMASALSKGFTKAIATNIKIEGLNKKTGRLLKGYVYKNGKPTKVKPK